MLEWLARFINTVDVKYTWDVNIMSENVIHDSGIFNGRQLVDCKLLALIFNTYKKSV